MKTASLFLFLSLLVTLGFSQAKSLRILFVGNSLTYTNNLPMLVKKEAEKKDLNLEVMMIAYPNYAIIDHLNDGDVQNELQSKSYDLVIVQQGPSSQSEGRLMLIEDGAKLKKICDQHNARLAYLMVWPALIYDFTFDGVIQNHYEAAKINDALILPVGEQWKKHIDETGKTDYYGPDGFHPSIKGSKVAAEVIVDVLKTELIKGK